MVFYRPKGRDQLQVVDGQQRLTTITIFLAALRDTLKDLGEDSLARGVQGGVERKDINNELRFVLLTETSYPYFQEYVQKFGNLEITFDPSPEEKGIQSAYDYERGRLQQIIDDINSSPILSEKIRKNKIRKTLQSIRDRLLALRVIVIELDNEDDAYVIFETLNTRGKELGPEDLVKNHLARLLPAKSADFDTTRTRWHKMTRQLWDSAANLDMSTYIHHFWLSREDYTSKKTLFKKFKEKVSKHNAKEILDDLESGVPIYKKIFDPAGQWKKEQRDIPRSLKALLTFRVRQPTPMVFALLRAYEAGEISLKQVRDTLAAIEQFHFKHTAIASLSSSGGISMMYAAAARDLFASQTPQERAKHLQEFRAKLWARTPERELFNAGFVELRYTSSDTRHRSLVRYILGKIDEYLRHDKIADYDLLTIEHLAPENPSGPSKVKDVGRIGNLILVSEKLNQKLKNKEFPDKKKILENAGVALDDALKKAKEWGDEQVNARSTLLAEIAYEKIWKT